MEKWSLKSPMPGTVLEVMVNPGQKVKRGEALVVVEAIKMENELVSEHEGVVETVSVKEDDFINAGNELVTVIYGD